MHSGTLIVTRNDPSDFTYTGTFLNNDFDGIGTIVSQNGSIYQGQFAFGVYHGVGTLRTVSESLQLQQQENENDDADENEREGGGRKKKGGTKMESVYTGEFLCFLLKNECFNLRECAVMLPSYHNWLTVCIHISHLSIALLPNTTFIYVPTDNNQQ